MDKAKEPFVPATEPPSMLWVAAILLSWICLSTAVIFGNREIMLGPSLFSYPITLTSAHLLFQVIATRVLHRFTTAISGAPSPEDEYALLPTGAALPEQGDETVQSLTPEARWKQTSVEMTWAYWRRNIVPPAVLFSASLVLSNWAYLLLGVAYIQQLKAISPAVILLAAFAYGTRQFSLPLLGVVLTISGGVGLSSVGEANFNGMGVAIQLSAIVVEATRITLIQILLQGEKGINPLKTLYYFAPICFLINASLILPIEGMVAITSIPRLGFGTLFINCCLTFALNLSAVYLLAVSTMVLSLAKVVKDIILVVGSALVLGDEIAPIQMVGYGIATVGLAVYKRLS